MEDTFLSKDDSMGREFLVESGEDAGGILEAKGIYAQETMDTKGPPGLLSHHCGRGIE